MKATRRDQILIWGTGGHAKVVADIIIQQDQFEIAGFIDDLISPNDPAELLGFPVLGSREILPGLQQQLCDKIVIAIGNCKIRMQLLDEVRESGWTLPVLIHPRAIIATDVTIEQGTVICAGAIIGPATQIAAGGIINTAASVDHDCELAKGVHISPGVHLAGGVTVGKESWIGIGSSVIEQTKIGDHVLVGAGSVVTKDLPANCKAWGVPAKVQHH